MYGKIAIIVAAGALTAACAQNGYNSRSPATQRAIGGAAIGAAAGAVGGAIIAGEGDDLEGALIGGAVGAALGAGVGAATAPDNRGSQQYYDQQARRYYTVDPQTGRTYWENGQIRSY